LQGVRRVQDASFASAAASVLGTLGVITAASRYGVAGWAGGRYVAESLMALALVLTLRTSLMHGGAWRLPSVSIFRDGFTISFALLLRSVLDNLVVPLLLWLGVSPSEAGHFGLGALMAFPVLLLPGVVGNLVIPRFVLMLDQPTELRRLLVRSVIGSTATALALVAVFAILGPLVIRWALPAYRESIEILLLLLVATPMRAAPIAMGGLLLAAQDLRSPVVINAACVVILTALAAWWIPLFGARGGALAIIITEMASLSGYALASSRVLRSRGGA
jgi:O-antigen/teichoic acid export membrane protein